MIFIAMKPIIITWRNCSTINRRKILVLLGRVGRTQQWGKPAPPLGALGGLPKRGNAKDQIPPKTPKSPPLPPNNTTILFVKMDESLVHV